MSSKRTLSISFWLFFNESKLICYASWFLISIFNILVKSFDKNLRIFFWNRYYYSQHGISLNWWAHLKKEDVRSTSSEEVVTRIPEQAFVSLEKCSSLHVHSMSDNRIDHTRSIRTSNVEKFDLCEIEEMESTKLIINSSFFFFFFLLERSI